MQKEKGWHEKRQYQIKCEENMPNDEKREESARWDKNRRKSETKSEEKKQVETWRDKMK